MAVEVFVLAAQHRCQVEAEAVDVHLLHPVAQAVQHHLQHPWMLQVQGVAAAAVVLATPRMGAIRQVPAARIQPAHRQRGAGLAGFRGVVVDHVQDHLDAGAVQRLHHLAELAARRGAIGLRGQAWVRAEEAQGVVAPVVDQAQRLQPLFVEMLVHRQQADGGDAQALQVGNGRGAAQAQVGAAQRLGHRGHAPGEAAHVQLVEEGVGQRPAWRGVAPPVEAVVDDAGLQGLLGVVAQVHLLRTATVGPEVAAVPAELADDLAGPGVQQQLVRVEGVALFGGPGAVGAKAVDQPGPGAGQQPVEHIAAARGQAGAGQRLLAFGVEQAQVDGLRVRGEDGEVHAVRPDAGAHRPGAAGLQPQGFHCRKTVASGGSVSSTESALPWQGRASLRASPKGVPTLLPP